MSHRAGWDSEVLWAAWRVRLLPGAPPVVHSGVQLEAVPGLFRHLWCFSCGAIPSPHKITPSTMRPWEGDW